MSVVNDLDNEKVDIVELGFRSVSVEETDCVKEDLRTEKRLSPDSRSAFYDSNVWL